MAGNTLTIKLTTDQQKQIKDVTGKSIAELHINLAANNEISDEELSGVAGGAGDTPTESLSLNFTKIALKYNTQ